MPVRCMLECQMHTVFLLSLVLSAVQCCWAAPTCHDRRLPMCFVKGQTLRVSTPMTGGLGGPTKRWCRPIVRNRRYALDRDALPWMMKGVRCSHFMRQCVIVILMMALWWR